MPVCRIHGSLVQTYYLDKRFVFLVKRINYNDCFILCYVMLCYVMLCYVMLCYVMLCYVTLHYIILYYIILYYIILYYIILYYIILYYIILYYIIFCSILHFHKAEHEKHVQSINNSTLITLCQTSLPRLCIFSHDYRQASM